MAETNAAAQAARSWARMADLAREALQVQLRLRREYADLRATMAGKVDAATALRAFADSAGREAERYWRAASELSFDYASDLLAAGSRASAAVLRDVRSTLRHAGAGYPPSAPAAAPPPSEADPADGGADPVPPAGDPTANAARPTVVTLRGRLGGRAETTLTVANRHPRPRRVQLAASPLTGPDGTVVDGALRVDPAQVTVPAGEESVVSVVADLGAPLTRPGSYHGAIEVSGGEQAHLDVTVLVDPAG
ncbi:MAG TPA: hypothetical protein VLJ59_13610 [Mycobacteriales bacterium]|nr:hypothetical protein [Mycobacteriales bacterium]